MTNRYTDHKPYDVVKRFFDVLAASVLILLLSPVFLLIALGLKLESPGAPVFYTSKRVGRRYKEFDFFKFRSMRPNSDRLLAQMQSLNQYAMSGAPAATVLAGMPFDDGEMLFDDDGWVNEPRYLMEQEQKAEKPFVKIANDPRITRVGAFIRNTSLDELPQLFNVLKGDMSLVGNRPLPPYEAEQLTADHDIERFLAPAGITGYWQVTERGKSGVAADSRKRLDAEYAQKYSFWLDLWILFKTPVAALQSADV
ncbi:MAG: sugar transferase [Saprospiraceae bacterium]